MDVHLPQVVIKHHQVYSDTEYSSTIDKNGEYHTIDGEKKQIQYQGSKEQQSDLEKIDQYMRDHPDF